MAPALIEAEKSGSSLTKHSNPSLQVTASRGIEMVEAPMEKPGHGDVLLHIKTTGICG
jgi:L-iditol 2-dehydrogenase